MTHRHPPGPSRRLGRKVLAGSASVLLAVGVIALTSGAHAEPSAPDLTMDVTATAVDRVSVSLDTAGIVDVRSEIDIFIRLDEQAVTEYIAGELNRGRAMPAAAAQRAQAQKVSRQHQQLRRELAKMGIAEEAAYRVGVNGLRVRARIMDMPKLAALPGVVSVAPVTLHKPANDTSVPWINTPEAWEFLGATGEDVIISIIDTGIDYTHASFGGSGDVADYEFIAQDTTVIPEVNGVPVFPTPKVIAGFDFAGPNYDASGEIAPPIPQPDPNPIDVHGHGSHVAGSAAGIEVTDSSGKVLVGSGVAPGAKLYAAKVFGDQAGSTALTADAIEWSLDPNGDGSMDDAAHVINMSLGSSFGSPNDPSALATQNATEVGVVVVASAGNSGQAAAYVTGSPAVAPGAISVAASIDGGLSVLGLQVNSPESVAGTYEAVESAIGVPLSEAGPLTGDLAVADPITACDAAGNPQINNPEELAGKIAFVQRGVCTFAVKHLAVQAAGAVGIVVFNNAPGDPIAMGGDSDGIEIPGVMVSLSDGQLLLGAMNAGQTVNVTMSDEIVIPKPELADLLAGFTSRGPGHGGSLFKPDVAAPGFSISSTAVGTGNQARISSGTSMAAPHVAGLAALLVQQHGLHKLTDPQEKAEVVKTIKSIILNTSVPAADSYPLALQGVGVVRADRAVKATAYTQPAGLSFGRVHAASATTITETVEVTNLAAAGRTFDVSFDALHSVPGVSVSHDPQVTVGPNGTGSFQVTLTLDPAAMPADLASFSQTEVDGWLVLDDGTETLRVGVLAVVDPAAAVTATVAHPGANPKAWRVNVSNPSQTTGVAHAFTLVKEGDDAGGVVEAMGVRTTTASGIEVVQFGLATDAWHTLSSRETQILLDPDNDGDFEYVLVAADLGLLQGVDPTGTVATALFDLTTGAGILEWFVTGDYNDAVQILTVDRYDDGVDAGFLDPSGQQRFAYQLLHFSDDELVGAQAGTINLSANVDGKINPSLQVPAGVSGAVDYPRNDTRSHLWLFPTNPVDSQMAVLQIPPRGR